MNDAVSVKVIFSPVFRTIFHCRERGIILAKKDASIHSLLSQLSDDSGGKIDKLVFENEREAISAGLMIQVNDRTYTGNALNQRTVSLRDQDVVSLLYFISGG